MKTSIKLTKGRPMGSGLVRGDAQLLDKIAELKRSEPGISIRKAMVRLGEGDNASNVRRVQGKYKKYGSELRLSAILRQRNRQESATTPNAIANRLSSGTAKAALTSSYRSGLDRIMAETKASFGKTDFLHLANIMKQPEIAGIKWHRDLLDLFPKLPSNLFTDLNRQLCALESAFASPFPKRK